jgi:hypothetical protein
LAGRSRVAEVDDQRVALRGMAPQGIVPAAVYGHEFGARNLGHSLRASMRLDLVVVTVDEEQGAADLAIHGLAGVNTRQDRLAGIRRVHDGERVGYEVVERVGGRFHRSVGLAVTARVVGNAAEALTEVRQLRLIDARVDDAPGRQEDHRLGAVAEHLVVELDALTVDEPFSAGQFRTHDITSPMTWLLRCA